MSDRRDRAANQAGFSLVELLVVIAILAILSAIAIPVFLRTRDRGFTAQVQSSLKNAALAAQSAASPGGYSALDDNEALLAEHGFTPTEGVRIGVSADDESFCVVAVHESIPAGEAWRVASYPSEVGTPVAGATACPDAATLADAGETPPVALAGDEPETTEGQGGTGTEVTDTNPGNNEGGNGNNEGGNGNNGGGQGKGGKKPK